MKTNDYTKNYTNYHCAVIVKNCKKAQINTGNQEALLPYYLPSGPLMIQFNPPATKLFHRITSEF